MLYEGLIREAIGGSQQASTCVQKEGQSDCRLLNFARGLSGSTPHHSQRLRDLGLEGWEILRSPVAVGSHYYCPNSSAVEYKRNVFGLTQRFLKLFNFKAERVLRFISFFFFTLCLFGKALVTFDGEAFRASACR